MRWQRRLRLVIAVFGAAFLVVLYFALRVRGRGGPPAGESHPGAAPEEAQSRVPSEESPPKAADFEGFGTGVGA